MSRYGEADVVIEEGYKFITIHLGKFTDRVLLRELAAEYGFNPGDAWIDWDCGFGGELTRLYVNWPG